MSETYTPQMSEAYDRLKDLPFTTVDFEKNPVITEPKTFNLAKDGSLVTLYPANSAKDVPEGLIKYMNEEFNKEVEKGDTYPHHLTMNLEEFKDYWFHSFATILITGDASEIPHDLDWNTEFLGTYYIKPNYIGRCSHVCNAGFIVNSQIRGKGLGKELGKTYLEWAPRLGYIYSVFNLVFETNPASWKIWDSLGFERIGYVKNVAILKPYNKPIGAIMFGKDLV